MVTGEDRRRSRNEMLPTPVKKLALKHDLEVFTPSNINSTESIEKIKEKDPNYLVIVAYGQILSKEFLESFPNKILNIHSSLLPKYRGAAPINWVIVDGEKETGVSIMLVDEGMDTGDVLLKEKIDISQDETAQSLHDRLAVLGGKMISKVLKDFKKHYEKKEIQDETEASYCGKITREMGHLDFSQNAQDIYNHFRGFYPWPGSFFYYKDEQVKVHNMNIILDYSNNKVGKVLNVSDEGIEVSCKNGKIVLTEIQFPNRRRMQVKDFLLGNDFEEGVILE